MSITVPPPFLYHCALCGSYSATRYCCSNCGGILFPDGTVPVQKETPAKEHHALEHKAERARNLAGEILACIRANRLRGEISCPTQAKEKDFDRVMDAFRERLFRL